MKWSHDKCEKIKNKSRQGEKKTILIKWKTMDSQMNMKCSRCLLKAKSELSEIILLGKKQQQIRTISTKSIIVRGKGGLQKV